MIDGKGIRREALLRAAHQFLARAIDTANDAEDYVLVSGSNGDTAVGVDMIRYIDGSAQFELTDEDGDVLLTARLEWK